MNFFGRRKPKEPSAPAPKVSKAGGGTPQQGVERIKKQLTTLEKREEFLESKIRNQLVEAKAKSKKGDKKGAMFCLKRKKMYEKEIEKLSGMRMNLEQQMMALESASINADAFGAMQAGSAAMQSMQAKINIENVEDLTDDITDAMQQADEISNAISNPIGAEMYDDDDLMNELEDMEASELEKEMMSGEGVAVPGVAAPAAPVALPAMPSAPSGAVQQDVDEDAAELARLEAEMAMAS